MAFRRPLALVLALLVAPLTGHAGTLTRFVDVFAGTDSGAPDFGTGGGAGNTFPGAVAPFGMLAWSPDTVPSKVNLGGGYSYPETQIRGFSLTHLSGVGCSIMQDIPFQPTTAPIVVSPSVAGSYDVAAAYLPTFDHEGERGEPGYYRVWLDRGTDRAVQAELTATTRAGLGRFVFPATETASVLVNAGGSAMANGDAVLAIDPARREVSGWVESGQFCYHPNRYRVFFAAEFDRPFAAWGTWTRQTVTPGSTTASDHAADPFHLRPLSGLPDPPSTSNGAQAGAYVTFDTREMRAVQVRVAISFVGVDNARANLRGEVPHWSLEMVRRRTRAAWNALLGRVRVRGGALEDTRTFYTMLYHALLGPTVFSDTNGEYLGMDGQVHVADGFTQYTTFSGWDVYRSQIPLLAMLLPERASDMMQSLVTNARESGWLPRWSVAAAHTDVMVGDPAAPISAGAPAVGATAVDRRAALAAMVKGATQATPDPGRAHVARQALAGYLALGWVPHDGTETSSGVSTTMFGDPFRVWGSAATTLEYATADFALARFAADLGESATCESAAARAAGWRHLFNPRSGHLEPRYADGSFLASFDPARGEGYAEGNGAQYRWMVPHDLAGLAEALGGPAAAGADLDAFFTHLNAGGAAPFAFLSNEPCALTPWIYDWLGQPEKTQDIVRRALLELFHASPSGYPGNDDVGQMSAWAVFAAIGLYPAIPGTDVLAIGSPLFPRIAIRLANGRLRVRSRGAARDLPYVARLAVNGREHMRPWIRFEDVRAGASLAFDLAATPSTTWGRAPGSAPPSFGPGRLDACAALPAGLGP